MISDCIMADKKGCKGLNQGHPHCGSKLCPFYKTMEMERQSQEYCRKRLEGTATEFKTHYKIKGGNYEIEP